MYCKNCGKDIGNANFCEQCGTKAGQNQGGVQSNNDISGFRVYGSATPVQAEKAATGMVTGIIAGIVFGVLGYLFFYIADEIEAGLPWSSWDQDNFIYGLLPLLVWVIGVVLIIYGVITVALSVISAIYTMCNVQTIQNNQIQSMPCPMCGLQLVRGTRVCPNCKTQLNQ